MFYEQRPAIAEAVARRISNRKTVIGSPGLSNLFDSEEASNVLESIMSRTWSSFTKFGIASAGVLTIIRIFLVFKFVLDSLLRGRALYGAYECNTHLLAAIWSTLAHLLLGRQQQNTKRTNTQQSNIPLMRGLTKQRKPDLAARPALNVTDHRHNVPEH